MLDLSYIVNRIDMIKMVISVCDSNAVGQCGLHFWWDIE